MGTVAQLLTGDSWSSYGPAFIIVAWLFDALGFAGVLTILFYRDIRRERRARAWLAGAAICFVCFSLAWITIQLLGSRHVGAISAVEIAASFIANHVPYFGAACCIQLAAGTKPKMVEMSIIVLSMVIALWIVSVVLLLLF